MERIAFVYFILIITFILIGFSLTPDLAELWIFIFITAVFAVPAIVALLLAIINYFFIIKYNKRKE
jgi:hypothetical protein